MRVLGLDLGSKRIGLALSDPAGHFAFPSGTLARKGRAHDLRALRELASEEGVEQVVVGVPKHMDGRSGVEARAAEDFARALAEETGLPVDTLDERWTSVEAERALREVGVKGKHVSDRVDAAAASIILRTYLDLRAGGAL